MLQWVNKVVYHDVDKIYKTNLLENGVKKKKELSCYKKTKEVAARKSAKFGRS